MSHSTITALEDDRYELQIMLNYHRQRILKHQHEIERVMGCLRDVGRRMLEVETQK